MKPQVPSKGKQSRETAVKPIDTMAKRLRVKYVLTAMLAVALVLLGIIGTVNVINYVNVCNKADERLHVIACNDGAFPGTASVADSADADKDTDGSDDSVGGSDSANDGGITADADNDVRIGGRKRAQSAAAKIAQAFSAPTNPDQNMSIEAPFDARFFTVTTASDGSVKNVNTSSVAAVSDDDARSCAEQVKQKGTTKGFLGIYRYSVVSTEERGAGANTMYIFLDCSRELSSFQTFLYASLGASAVGLAAVLILVMVFSKSVIRPVVESYARQKRFITDASHEIKTPLAVIDAANEVQEIESGESEWTQSIHEQVARLTSLTERLVFLARMDEGAAGFDMSDVDLSELVEKVAEPFVSVALSRGGKRLSCDVEPDLRCKGDTASLSQLLELLLDNATRYGSDECVVTLSLHRVRRTGLVLRVSNAVDKMPEGDLNKLFERFYRADTSRNSQTGGSGVGLSVARGIVEAHGGSITCAAAAPHEITFTVVLH